jgi:hypothetical protein
MSAFGGKADMTFCGRECLLITQSGHAALASGQKKGLVDPSHFYDGNRSVFVVFCGDVVSRVVGHQCRGHQAYHCAGGDIDRDCMARLIGGEQGRCDQWCRTASDDRGELIAERGTAVKQTRRKRLGNQRGLRAVLHVVWNEREHDRNEYERRDRGVHHSKVDKPKTPVTAAPVMYIFLRPILSEDGEISRAVIVQNHGRSFGAWG